MSEITPTTISSLFFFYHSKKAIEMILGLPAVSSIVAGLTHPISSNHNTMKDYEVISPPDDTVSCMKFSPPSTYYKQTTTSSLLEVGITMSDAGRLASPDMSPYQNRCSQQQLQSLMLLGVM